MRKHKLNARQLRLVKESRILLEVFPAEPMTLTLTRKTFSAKIGPAEMEFSIEKNATINDLANIMKYEMGKCTVRVRRNFEKTPVHSLDRIVNYEIEPGKPLRWKAAPKIKLPQFEEMGTAIDLEGDADGYRDDVSVMASEPTEASVELAEKMRDEDEAAGEASLAAEVEAAAAESVSEDSNKTEE